MDKKIQIFSIILAITIFQLIINATYAQSDRGVKVIPKSELVALVIGNAGYDAKIGTLKNPVNDANDMAEALRRLGFNIIGGKAQINLNRRQMIESIREFGGRLSENSIGIFYYAGHGIQVDKRNYLIPITNSLQYQEDAEFEAVDLDAVLKEMERVEDSLKILIVDACRNNELPRKMRSQTNGLAEPIRKPSGVFLAFAARDGQTADENPRGRNGLYTQELLKNLEIPDLPIDKIFKRTGSEVSRLTSKRQEPIVYETLYDEYFLKRSENGLTQNSQNNVLPTNSVSQNENVQSDSSNPIPVKALLKVNLKKAGVIDDADNVIKNIFSETLSTKSIEIVALSDVNSVEKNNLLKLFDSTPLNSQIASDYYLTMEAVFDVNISPTPNNFGLYVADLIGSIKIKNLKTKNIVLVKNITARGLGQSSEQALLNAKLNIKSELNEDFIKQITDSIRQ